MTPACLGIFLWLALAFGASAQRELIRDPGFQRGFHLLDPKVGKRIVYAEIHGPEEGQPTWDLAQWSSRFPLQTNQCWLTGATLICSNAAKRVVVRKPGTSSAGISLAVNAGVEYAQARLTTAEPWVHLLVQQNFDSPPALGELSACEFQMEARLERSVLVTTNGYSGAIHAAQFLVYLTVANHNPEAAGYNECFWFGIPIYDDRDPMVPAYEARDFGDTKLFIFTPGSSAFARDSVHGKQWVKFSADLLPLMRQGLDHAATKGFIKGSKNPADYRPLGIFIGWEVPGMFDVDLQIRNLSLKAIP